LLADSSATVLVEGETGTGKELVARALHYLSRRAGRPFVPVNCGAIPETLFERELFGHQRGAFTDAQMERPGLLQAAHTGTLCLDEVASLSLRNQVVLLRVLQDGSFRVLGSTRESLTDARIIALTNISLLDLVQKGAFRADLYYRLSVLPITLPPLRERPEDILPLARHFIRKHERPGHQILGIAQQAELLLEAYDWPGNVRQLENVVVRAIHLRVGPSIRLEDLEISNVAEAVPPPPHIMTSLAPLRVAKREAIEAFERTYLMRLMCACNGNVSAAARLAGKDRRDLGRLLKKYRIRSADSLAS
jgi:DNA-binding NtrC family response regulator